MLTKDELNELRYMARDLAELEAELEALYTKIEGVCSPKITDEPRGGEKLDILELYDKLMQKHQEIKTLNKTYYRERERVSELIQHLSPEGKTLIKLRYFENNEWSDIASLMVYSVRHLHRLHSTVLCELKKS